MAPVGAKELIVQAARRWVIATLGLAPEVGDAKIIPPSRSDDLYQAPAPNPPFIVVNLIDLNADVGTLERRAASTTVGPVTTWHEVRAQGKQATLSLNAVGAEAEDWLTRLTMFLDTFEPEYGTLARVLRVQDLSALSEDGSLLRRHVLDILVEYRVEVDASALTPAQAINLTVSTTP